MADVLLRIPEPNPKQAAFFADKHRHVAYGGARGGGKSWAVRVKAVLLALRWDGIKILIVRKSYRELTNNHIDPMRAMLPKSVARYNKQEKTFTFGNGSTIQFGYCATEGDLAQYQGAEYDVIMLDEATQLQEAWIRKINLAVRGPNGLPKRTYYTCNPGGPAHGYIKRLFVDRNYQDAERAEDYSFVQAFVTDNAALMQMQPEYLAELEALPPKLRAAWLEGRWDVYDGQFFEEFADRPEHYADRIGTHVIAPFEIDPAWTIYRSFDWGYSKPFSCAWWAVDYDGCAYRILELYGCTRTPNEGLKWTPDKVAYEIHKVEVEHRWLKGKHIIGVADPAIWDAQTGRSIAEQMARRGVMFSPGDHERLAGWQQVHHRMAFDDNGRAMLYVFSTCRAFIRTMPLLQYDEHKVEDLDTDGEDHVADEVRYFCMARPIAPRRKPEPDEYYSSPAYQALQIPREDILPRAAVERVEVIEHGRDDAGAGSGA